MTGTVRLCSKTIKHKTFLLQLIIIKRLTMWSDLRKRYTQIIDKEKHVTCVCRRFFNMRTYGNYVNGTSGYMRVTRFSLSTLCKLRLRKSRHFCPEFGTRFDSIMSALWDHWIACAPPEQQLKQTCVKIDSDSFFHQQSTKYK